MALRFLVRWSVALAAIVLIVSGVAVAQTPRRGGVLRVGNLGEPPALDAHGTTASITETLTNHIYEGLYSLDATNRPIPMLAESHSVSRDGLTYTFKLRQAVKFHNGKEMTAEDVVPSLARWGKQSIYGKALFAQVADWRAVDRYTVEMRLKEKSAIVLISLAVPNNFGAIYPREIVEKFPPEVKVTEYVGTGPFKLVEWKPDQYIRMVRFDDYKPRNEKPNGYGGGKTPRPVEIAAWHTKLAGLPWNEHNREKARRLLKEAGYKSEPVRFMTTQEYKWMYDFALLTKQQLEDAGFTIDLQVVDWATLVKRRNNPKEYDVFTTGMGAFYDPTHHIYLTATWPGWTTDEDILKLQAELARETDPKKRMVLWEQQTRQFYEKVPVIRYGDLFGLRAMRTSVKGFNERTERIRFYNVWLDK